MREDEYKSYNIKEKGTLMLCEGHEEDEEEKEDDRYKSASCVKQIKTNEKKKN